MTAPSENVSVKLKTTVYANVVFNKENIAQINAQIHFYMFVRSLTLERNNGAKRNQGTFRIDKNV